MATDINQVQIGQKVSFEVYPSGILGQFKNVVVDSFLSPKSAMDFGVDIYSLHANVYPTLPSTVPNDPTQYSWVRVRHSSGEYSTIGTPYVKGTSIVVITKGKLTLVLEDITPADQSNILIALSANGYKPVVNTLEQS